MNGHNKDWLQGQFDKAASEKEAEDLRIARKAKRRKAIGSAIKVIVLFALIGVAAVWFLYREQAEVIWQDVYETVFTESQDKETRSDRAVDKAKDTIDDVNVRAEASGKILDSVYND